MELVTALLTTCVVIGVVYITLRGRAGVKRPLPPGPRGFALYRDFIKAVLSQTLHVQFGKWAKEFGDIFCLPLLGQNMVILNSVGVMKQMYIGTHSRITNDRPPSFLGKYFFLNGGITFSPAGQKWKRLRQQFHASINLHVDGGRKIEETLRKELRQALTYLKVTGTTSNVDICDIASHYLLTVVHMMLTGEGAPIESPNLGLMRELDMNMNKYLAADQEAVLSNLPFLRHLPNSHGRRWKTMLDLRKNITDIFFNDYEANFPNGEEGIINIFKEAMAEEDELMTGTQVKALIMELIGAGYVTSKASITTMLLLILHNPEVQKKLQEEIDTVIGDRAPCLKDQYQMPYLSAIFWETMRYASILPTGFPHMANDDIEFNGWRIPKDSVIFGNLFHINHDTKTWADPWAFRPERFLQPDHQPGDRLHEDKKKIVSFGVGKRRCPGENFARSRIYLFIATVFQQYDFLPPVNETLPPVSPNDWEPGLILMPENFRCRIRPRRLELPEE